MDNRARLSSILSAIDELKTKEESAIFGATISISAREYNQLEICSTKLMAIYRQKKKLLEESKELQIKIDEENRETIL